MVPEHGYEWLWVTLVVILILGLLFMFYYGLFPSPKATLQSMRPMTVLYVEQQCKYSDIDPAFTRMAKETSGLFYPEETTTVAFFFDNTRKMKQSFMCRSAVGLILNSNEAIRKAQHFVKSSHRYKIRSFPSAQCMSMRIKFRNFVSHWLAGVYWGKLRAQLTSEYYAADESLTAVEIYDFLNPKNKTIIMNMPLERRESFSFSEFPRPAYFKA